MSGDASQVAFDALEAARQNLVRVLSVFLLGLLSTIIFLRFYAFDKIQTDALSNAEEIAATAGLSTEDMVIFLNPFEVIILQAKIGIVVGVIIVVPYVIYLARDALRQRGYWLPPTISRRRYALFGLGIAALFVVGVSYAYFVMVPYIMQFVVLIAVEAQVTPLFRISSFINFVILYSIIFGFAAQLPLIMAFTVKGGIVSYRFYREKWKHFVIFAALISALITSPDPFTQFVVLGPVIGIYFLGLGIVRVVARKEIRENERLRDSMVTTEDEDADAETGTTAGAEAAPNGGTETASPTGAAVSSATDDLIDRGMLDVGAAVVDNMRIHSKKLGLIFLAVSSLAFYWLIYYGIAMVRDDMLSHMNPELSAQVQTVQLEIFEFVFLVVKYSAIAGVLVVLPVALYYSRETLAAEGVITGDGSAFYYISRVGVVVGLFVAGVTYAYYGMLPVLISILSNSIVESGMNATFTIGDFIDFVVIVTLLIGVMAELPASMYFLVTARVVRYETLKAKWRHFTVVVLVIGALVTSPDPFTMIVVAVPLSGFYLISLGITRVLCHRTIKRVRTERREIGLEA